jgi:hypothetical protein
MFSWTRGSGSLAVTTPCDLIVSAFALPRSHISKNLPDLGRAQHPDEQIPTGNDYGNYPVAQLVRFNLQKKKDETNCRLSELQDDCEQFPHLVE